ncbi:hypothetical protein M446_6412 [Methylobacterium sp. 4-46]|nr:MULTISPECIES: hypothetical protein [Methylobacterium]ACA20675.1 hypothetical protein M446_6412 [Methylobacterium sp. 4-46]WFT79832.1 hypothetical protein QA634_32390 [Methylobacterium nodulans]
MRLVGFGLAFLPFLIVLIVSAMIAAVAFPFRALAAVARKRAQA